MRTWATLAVIIVAFVGCKKEVAGPSETQKLADIQREQLKVQKAALLEQKRDAIKRDYQAAIDRIDAAHQKSVDNYIKMLEDGLLSKEQVDKHLAAQKEINDGQHKMQLEYEQQAIDALEKEAKAQ